MDEEAKEKEEQRQKDEHKLSLKMGNFFLVVSIVAGILFFNGTIPFIFFLFPVLFVIYLKF